MVTALCQSEQPYFADKKKHTWDKDVICLEKNAMSNKEYNF